METYLGWNFLCLRYFHFDFVSNYFSDIYVYYINIEFITNNYGILV